jgi:hypothetical protein
VILVGLDEIYSNMQQKLEYSITPYFRFDFPRSLCPSPSCHHESRSQPHNSLDIIIPLRRHHTQQHNSALLKQSSWFILSVLVTLLLPPRLLQTQTQASTQNKLLQLLTNHPAMMLLFHASISSDTALKTRASKRQLMPNIALVSMTIGRLSRSPGLHLLCSLILAYHRDVRRRIQAQATQLPQTLSLPILLKDWKLLPNLPPRNEELMGNGTRRHHTRERNKWDVAAALKAVESTHPTIKVPRQTALSWLKKIQESCNKANKDDAADTLAAFDRDAIPTALLHLNRKGCLTTLADREFLQSVMIARDLRNAGMSRKEAISIIANLGGVNLTTAENHFYYSSY